MNNSKQNNICDKDEKSSFVVIHSTDTCFEENTVWTQHRRYSNEIIEYTDEVSDYMRSLYTKITINLEEYFQEKVDLEDVNERFRQYFYIIKNYCLNAGLITEYHTAYKCKLLKDIYRSYRHNAVIVANDITAIEGQEYAQKYFASNWDGCIYYSSTYYYKCEAIRIKIMDIANQLALEEKIDHFETESIDKRRRYIYDYGYNYAWLWKNKKNLLGDIKMNDLIIPPENMRLLYSGDINPTNDRTLFICYEENWVELDIRKNNFKWKNLNEILKQMNFTILDNERFVEFFRVFCC